MSGHSSKKTFVITMVMAVVTMFLVGCSSTKIYTSPAFTVAQSQQMVPVLPFISTLVPESFSEAVFNDYVDSLNDSHGLSNFAWFAIVKDDLAAVEKILSPAHIYISGEIWSYIENSGCCSTEMRVKSRLRIFRVGSRELLWEAELPFESFFEHDLSTAAHEREKLARNLSARMTAETIKALKSVKRMSIE